MEVPELASWRYPSFASDLIAAMLSEKGSDVENQCHLELGLGARDMPFSSYNIPPSPIPINKPPAQLHRRARPQVRSESSAAPHGSTSRLRRPSLPYRNPMSPTSVNPKLSSLRC